MGKRTETKRADASTRIKRESGYLTSLKFYARVAFLACFGLWILGASVPAFATDSAIVEQVIDGETLQLTNGRQIRLIGIRSMESKNPNMDRQALERAIYLSRRFIQNTVVGRPVILSHDTKFQGTNHLDKSGRELVYVWYTIHYREPAVLEEKAGLFGITAESRMLNADIIKQGYGFADRRTDYSERDTFIRFEDEARAGKAGLWNPSPAFYENLLEQAKGARTGSLSKFVPQSVRKMSLESARTTLSELIKMVPSDYRAYYERSWLGVDPVQDSVTTENLEDIDKAIERSSNNPKCYAQKHFILRLLGKHAAAEEAYQRAVDLASKFGLTAGVSEPVAEKMTGNEGRVTGEDEEVKGLLQDAERASLNHDHFLIFMARVKELENHPKTGVQEIFEKMMKQQSFKNFYRKDKAFLEKASPRQILYKTQWGLRGWDAPEAVLKEMETPVAG